MLTDIEKTYAVLKGMAIASNYDVEEINELEKEANRLIDEKLPSFKEARELTVEIFGSARSIRRGYPHGYANPEYFSILIEKDSDVFAPVLQIIVETLDNYDAH